MRKLLHPFLILAMVLSCATLKSDAKVMSGAFATCAQADLGQLLTNLPASLATDLFSAGVTVSVDGLLTVISKLVGANAPTLEADLTAIAGLISVDAIKCALAAIEAVLAPPAGSATPATKAEPPGLARAKVWLAKQGANQ